MRGRQGLLTCTPTPAVWDRQSGGRRGVVGNVAGLLTEWGMGMASSAQYVPPDEVHSSLNRCAPETREGFGRSWNVALRLHAPPPLTKLNTGDPEKTSKQFQRDDPPEPKGDITPMCLPRRPQVDPRLCVKQFRGLLPRPQLRSWYRMPPLPNRLPHRFTAPYSTFMPPSKKLAVSDLS